jgi:hypothetical protein
VGPCDPVRTGIASRRAGQRRLHLLGLAQPVALNLAGRRPGQVLDELDHVRVLVPAQVVLAPLAQLVRQCISVRTRWEPGRADHERLDTTHILEQDPDHGGFGDRRMLHEAPLDVGRRDPQPADLDHVVRAALIDEVAVGVERVAVAGVKPLAAHREAGLGALVPVVGSAAVAPDHQVARITGRHVQTLLVDEAQLVPGDGAS